MATPATTPVPASRSRATRPPARRFSTANFSSTPRAKTSSPACARPNRGAAQESFARRLRRTGEGIRKTLEKHFKDVQDFEFTIQDGKVFMLQTRNGKRTGLAAVRFAIDMVKEKLIDWKTAIRRVPADQLDQVLAPIFDRQAVKSAKCIAQGLPAGPGAASGKMYLNADRAAAAAAKGEKVLLVRNETSPEDLRGMIAAEGILTAKGGVSSHAALVARQMGKVCVCGASALQIDYAAKTVTRRRQQLQGRRFHLHQRHGRAKSIRARSRRPPRKSSRCWSRNRSTRKRARPSRCSRS